MSFILEALKKAERERDLARVPTLTTVHIPVLVTGRRIALAVAAGVLLVGGGLSIWLLRPVPSMAPSAATESGGKAAAMVAAGAGESGRSFAPAQALQASPPTLATPGLPRGNADEQPAAPGQASPEPMGTPQGAQVSPRQPAGSGVLAAASGGGRGGRGQPDRGTPNVPPQTEPVPEQSAPVFQPAPPPVAPPPVAPAPVPIAPPAPPPSQPSPQAGRPPTAVVAPPPATTSARPPNLVDAMAKMKLDLFVYTDVPTDRMIIINGRKYVEGERVDGLY